MSRVTISCLTVLSLLWPANSDYGQTATPPAARTGFTDITRESGLAEIVAKHQEFMAAELAKLGNPEYQNWWLSGFTLVDLDGDGDLDLHLAGHGQHALLASNDGKGGFTGVDGKFDIRRGAQKPGQPILPDIPFPGGEIRMVYDLDEVGKLDILASYGDDRGQTYLNDSRPGQPPVFNFKPYDPGFNAFSRGVAFADVNRDGIVDYMYTGDEGRWREFNNLNVSLGNGNCKWQDGPKIQVLKQSGAIPVDLNGDGYLDLISSQRGYSTAKRWILLNDPAGAAATPGTGGADSRLKFTRAADCGLAEEGAVLGCGDVDQDGDLDLICIDLEGEGTDKRPRQVLYLNDGKAHFTRQALPPLPAPRYATWGGAIVTDFDDDGVADIVMNGRNFLLFLRGLGEGRFEKANAAWGLPESIGSAVDEGLCFGDIDGDGDLDVLTYASEGRRGAALFRNDLPRRHWLNVQPVGRKGNQAAAGTIIRIFEPGTGKLLWHEQVAIWGRQSFHSYYFRTRTERHFGLGDREKADVTVTFYPSGKKVEKRSVPADTTLEVREE